MNRSSLHLQLTDSYKAAFTHSTASNHHRQSKAYLSFMIAYSFEYLCPPLEACLIYIRCLANSFKNVKSVRNYISGARTFLTMVGGNPVHFSSPLVSTLLKGIANQSAHEERQAPPLPRRRLLQMCDDLRSVGTDGEVAAAACLFGVATFLRQSNFLLAGATPGHHLIFRRHILLTPRGMDVTVTSTKTLSPSSGGVVIPVARVPGSRHCPVAALLRAWALAPGARDGALFSLPSTGRPLTTTVLTTMARRALAGRGWPLAHTFTIHSLRRTGARLAASAGATEAELMLHGTWTSSAVRTYVPRQLTSSVPSALASCLEGPDQTEN